MKTKNLNFTIFLILVMVVNIALGQRDPGLPPPPPPGLPIDTNVFYLLIAAVGLGIYKMLKSNLNFLKSNNNTK